MAGAGYKLFNTGDVLTAAQVNTYLQEQAVMRFANAAARTTALSGVLAEGMMSYLDDTNSVEVYNGSAWVSVGNTGDITAVTAGTGITGGGTSGDVTITNSMATAIDAKGDLIAGTGADAFARLAVGANNRFLIADSAQSTGLNWAGAEISYTPTWGSTGTAPSLGNGVLTGNYVRIGDVVVFRIRLQIGSTTTTGTGNYTFTLPIAMSSTEKGLMGNAAILDGGVAWYFGYEPVSVLAGHLDKFNLIRYDGSTVGNTTPITFGNTDNIYVWGQYYV